MIQRILFIVLITCWFNSKAAVIYVKNGKVTSVFVQDNPAPVEEIEW